MQTALLLLLLYTRLVDHNRVQSAQRRSGGKRHITNVASLIRSNTHTAWPGPSDQSVTAQRRHPRSAAPERLLLLLRQRREDGRRVS